MCHFIEICTLLLLYLNHQYHLMSWHRHMLRRRHRHRQYLLFQRMQRMHQDYIVIHRRHHRLHQHQTLYSDQHELHRHRRQRNILMIHMVLLFQRKHLD
jgi:hypothetical protein